MTTIPAEQKKRHRLTQEDCDTARLLIARQRTLKEIGEIIGVDSSTVGKIRLAGYDLQTYLNQRKAMNEKTKENKRAAEAEKMREVLKNRWPKSLQEHVEKHAEENDKKILEQLTKDEKARKMQTKMDCNQLSFEEYLRMNDFKEPEDPDIQKLMRLIAKMSDKIVKRLDMLISLQKGGEAHE